MSSTKAQIEALVAQYFDPLIYQPGGQPGPNLSPGGVCGIYYGGTNYYFNRGYINANGDAPNQDTVFGIGSVTKVFTTSILGQQGAPLLNDSVNAYLPPGYALTPGFQPVKFGELATFTAGLPRVPPQGEQTSQTQFVQDINSFSPPKGLPSPNVYSNMSIGFLGQIVLAMDGFSGWDGAATQAWYQAKLFDALSMNHTGFPAITDANHQESEPYYYKSGAKNPYQIGQYEGWCPWGTAGRVYSTARDMIRFIKANVGESVVNKQPVPQTILDGMATAQTPWPASQTGNVRQALAWVTINANGPYPYSHKNGGLNGVSAELTVCPSLKLGVVFLRNLHQFPAPDAAVKGLTEGLIAMATGGVGQR